MTATRRDVTAGSPLARLRRELRGGAPERQVEAVARLAPRAGLPAIRVLEAALDRGEPPAILEVALRDALLELTHDRSHVDALERMLRSAAAAASEDLRTMIRIALQRYHDGVADGMGAGSEIVVEARAVRPRIARRAAAPVASMTVIVHGTWAADGDWWRPGGDFFEYLKGTVGVADLYEGNDRFTWKAPNEDKARRNAAAELAKWIRDRSPATLTVLGHSHGANVAMMATRHDVAMDRLLMLSPVVRKDYFADWENVGAGRSVYSSYDPVVAIAKGKKRFPGALVEQKRLKANGHGASHEPAVWTAESVAAFARLP